MNAADEHTIRLIRAVRARALGFATLETQRVLGIPADIDHSFRVAVDRCIDSLAGA